MSVMRQTLPGRCTPSHLIICAIGTTSHHAATLSSMSIRVLIGICWSEVREKLISIVRTPRIGKGEEDICTTRVKGLRALV